MYLDLNDLEFTVLDYKQHGDGLRDWLLSSLDYHPASYAEISRATGIYYRVLLHFIHKRTTYMSYKNMCKLRSYIKTLMVQKKMLSPEGLKDEEYFAS